jgi:hypothetical protein
MKLGRRWSIDDNGVAWYARLDNGRRQRGVIRMRLVCQEEFPAHPRNPGLYCSLSCRGKVCGGSTRATRPDLFEQWTPEECWLAGLIWTDGHLGHEHGDNWRVTLRMTDEDVIAEAARIAGCPYSTNDNPHGIGAHPKPVHSIRFGERKAVGRIAALGMSEPKLDGRYFPAIKHPASFLRGAFDGDGSVHRQVEKRIKGHPERLMSVLFGGPAFLAGVQDFLYGYGIKHKTIWPHPPSGRVSRIGWAHHDSLRLAAVMYGEPGPCLDRKHQRFVAHPERM